DERDVVRHRLVQEIIKAYDRHSAASAHPGSPRKGEQLGKGQHSDAKAARSSVSPKGSWGQSH
ncbi:MAG TPA: PhoH family protein, partial [Nitrospira sp.]|nr:PhoH family protein [Nitrospira sp.]HMZ97048.1 PhoH family protein [Nitrospira sp.]